MPVTAPLAVQSECAYMHWCCPCVVLSLQGSQPMQPKSTAHGARSECVLKTASSRRDAAACRRTGSASPVVHWRPAVVQVAPPHITTPPSKEPPPSEGALLGLGELPFAMVRHNRSSHGSCLTHAWLARQCRYTWSHRAGPAALGVNRRRLASQACILPGRCAYVIGAESTDLSVNV